MSIGRRISDYEKPWRECTAPVGGELTLHVEGLFNRGDITDLYMSQQVFHRWRGIADLCAIGCNYVDLDYHNRARWRGRPPRDVAMAVLDTLEDASMPLPSYVLSTGRGLACVWLHELLPAVALPRWNAVQRRLADVLTGYGADKRALDAARVFRVVGSINSRAEWSARVVSLAWWQGSPSRPTRHEFATLADEVLPITHADLISLRAERATRKASGKDRAIAPARRLTMESYCATVFEDLQRLRHHRVGTNGELAAGHRDSWIFVAAQALAWMCPPDALAHQVPILAAQAAGWSPGETSSRMAAVLKRARMAADGKLISFHGAEVDPRYRMKATTIIEWLSIEPGEMRSADLRVLVDQEIRRERNTQRTKASRQRRGANDREEQRIARLELGRKCLYLAAKSGMSRAELAMRFQCSTGQVSKAMAEARAMSR